MKKTILAEFHESIGAKMVDFHGWYMPVQYEGILKEHEKVRTSAGLFDVSHMGEFLLEGEGAENYLQSMIANNVKKITDFQCQYSPLCYDNGTMVDDLLIYRYSPEKYMIVVNASNIEKDYDWFQGKLPAGSSLTLKNKSDEISLLALQGPKSEQVMEEVFQRSFVDLKFYRFLTCEYEGKEIVISRTGYTGEDGFEIYLENGLAESMAKKLLADERVKPVGLGARDTLRFEAKLPLYGNELTDQVTPIDAGLKKFCDFKSGDQFYGKERLEQQVEEGADWKLYGLEMIDKGIARTGYEVYSEESGQEESHRGRITSGSFCPSLKTNCALALLKPKSGKPGTELFVDIRGKKKKAKIVKTPFYTRS